MKTGDITILHRAGRLHEALLGLPRDRITASSEQPDADLVAEARLHGPSLQQRQTPDETQGDRYQDNDGLDTQVGIDPSG